MHGLERQRPRHGHQAVVGLKAALLLSVHVDDRPPASLLQRPVAALMADASRTWSL